MPEDITPDPNLEAGDGQSDASDKPEWLPEKFETPEALAKSYSELERKLTEAGSEKNNLEAQLEDLYGRMQTLEASQQPQQRYDPNTDPNLMAYESAMENGDYRAAFAIQTAYQQQLLQQQQTQQQPQAPQKDYEAWAFVAEQTAAQLVGGPEEWSQYKDRVAAEANSENFEGLSAQQAGQKLARLYKMVKADDVLNNQQTMAERKAEADRAAKVQAQTMAGASGRMPEPTRDEAAVEAILKASKSGTYQSLLGG